MNPPELFLSNIAGRLSEKGWTRTTLGEMSNIEPTTISKWFRLKRVPGITTLQKLAKAFGCEPSDLLKEYLPPSPKGSDPKRSEFFGSKEPGAIEVRMVPIISWAHAGEAAAYEELPKSWQDQTYSTCRDPKSFALIVEGDSMSPHCLPGDLVVLMPSEEARNGCIVVAKLADDGIILRRYTRLSTGIRLSAYNPVYPAADYPPEAFSWIYPVHSTVRREWS